MNKPIKKNIFRDPFGNWYFIKRFLISILGLISYNRFNGFNKLKVFGSEHLVNLPDQNVLFVSNHQTYFADVSAMYHVFCSVKNGYINTIKNPVYLLNPKVDMHYVAAKETMNEGILANLFKLVGAITVKRTWKSGNQNINRMVDLSEINNIKIALSFGWVVTFPQGTIMPFAPGRKGTARLIKDCKPIVIPVVINGFRRAFDKKGLRLKKIGGKPTLTFKPPLEIEYETESTECILNKIMDAIEQSSKFLKIAPISIKEKT